MPKYTLAFIGGAEPSSYTPEERQQEMAAWMSWMGGLGEALLDGGAPFAGSTALSSSGRGDASSGLTGYSVLQADSLDDAASKSQGCPHIKAGGTIEIFEQHDMSDMM